MLPYDDDRRRGKHADSRFFEQETIAAHSPQAKGRVERNHGLDQDRLVKELRLAGISAIVQANLFLEKTCLPKMSRKFSRPVAEQEDAHVPMGKYRLERHYVS